MSKLNALKVKSINKIGMHSDGNGLYLKVQPSLETVGSDWSRSGESPLAELVVTR